MAVLKRCDWSYSGNDPLYIKYHDEEWGVPLHQERKLFEFLVLEGAQAGLSWLTVLKKRENYKQALDGFNIKKIAGYDEEKIRELMGNPGIIRNRLKLDSVILNAKCFLRIQEEFGSFDNYIWDFVPDRNPIKNRWESVSKIPSRTNESDAISNDLHKRGLKFTGSTICYAYMQAIGMVNDHITRCFRYSQL
jgi:DNA-3-methyladenine glycosylase I